MDTGYYMHMDTGYHIQYYLRYLALSGAFLRYPVSGWIVYTYLSSRILDFFKVQENCVG